MLLKGVIDAAVMGGISHYDKVSSVYIHDSGCHGYNILYDKWFFSPDIFSTKLCWRSSWT